MVSFREGIMAGASGLDGVVAADTVLSDVDGEAGRLLIRGVPVAMLVAGDGFEGLEGDGQEADHLDRQSIGPESSDEIHRTAKSCSCGFPSSVDSTLLPCPCHLACPTRSNAT